MESNVAEERIESNNPKAEEESKNEQTVISGDEGNFESCKNPVTVVVDHCAEVSMVSCICSKMGFSYFSLMLKILNFAQSNPMLALLQRYIHEFNEVELCSLGMAIPTVVTIAEILKRNGFAI
ncbi:hypothetical protein V6N13_083262 [Hibiscus sabdariffa]|uniref:DNA/RNA-binding protein Alba-like domain-containing protein n=1 Tax=Hibiscus sabdariffa TaxID=183260 RepID=A0ABR2SYC2_9ROSI